MFFAPEFNHPRHLAHIYLITFTWNAAHARCTISPFFCLLWLPFLYWLFPVVTDTVLHIGALCTGKPRGAVTEYGNICVTLFAGITDTFGDNVLNLWYIWCKVDVMSKMWCYRSDIACVDYVLFTSLPHLLLREYCFFVFNHKINIYICSLPFYVVLLPVASTL